MSTACQVYFLIIRETIKNADRYDHTYLTVAIAE